MKCYPRWWSPIVYSKENSDKCIVIVQNSPKLEVVISSVRKYTKLRTARLCHGGSEGTSHIADTFANNLRYQKYLHVHATILIVVHRIMQIIHCDLVPRRQYLNYSHCEMLSAWPVTYSHIITNPAVQPVNCFSGGLALFLSKHGKLSALKSLYLIFVYNIPSTFFVSQSAHLKKMNSVISA